MRDHQAADPPYRSEVGGPYAWYVLTVLLIAFTLSQADRLILSILTESVKADIHVSDSQIGFLFGTAFGVFYAVFGVSVGRLADFLSRRMLLATGMILWCVMTILSGVAANYGQLAFARMAIGIGEATVGPCCYSLLSDRFPKSIRATVLAIVISGIYLGNGLSKYLGGLILQLWTSAYPHNPPFGLHAWQIAFFVIGAPGVLVALWVATLREPPRGMADGLPPPPKEPHPFRRTLVELASAVPPLTLFNAARFGRRPLLLNLAAAAVCAALAIALTRWFGDIEQWVALFGGTYATFSWMQSVHHRDRATFSLIFRTPSYVALLLAYSLISLITWAVGFWNLPYAMRVLHAPPAQVGAIMGLITAAGGLGGAVAGGRTADLLLKRNPSGRVIIGLGSAIVLPLSIVAMVHARSLPTFYAIVAVYTVFGNMWVGACAAATQDLVLPHMRGAAAAANALGFTLIGLCIGPYVVGKLSVALHSLGLAMELLVWLIIPTLALFVYAYRNLPKAEATRIERAQAASLASAAA